MPNIDEEKRDSSSPVWDMSQERAFIETLTNQRLNFFLIIFSIVIAGALNSKVQLFFKLILSCGAILCGLLAWTIFRSNQKLGNILEHLKQDNNTHPFTIIDQQTKGRSVRWIIGKAIPIGCSSFLLIIAILSLFNIAKVTDLTQYPTQAKTNQVDINKKTIDSIKSNIHTINIHLDSFNRNIKEH